MSNHIRKGEIVNGDHESKARVVAARLLAAGFWPIPLYSAAEKPGSDGKRPIGQAWGGVRHTPDTINGVYQAHRDAGVGVALGPGKGPKGRWLIDVEGDGPAAEESFLKLAGGEVVDTLGWTSARGSHRLFLVPDDFIELMRDAGAIEGKGRKVGVYKLDSVFPDLEFRIGGVKPDGTIKQVQSACPPTLGTDGLPRKWGGGKAPLELPQTAVDVLQEVAERAERLETPPRPVPALRPSPPSDWSAYVRAAVVREVENVERAANKTRNITLNTAAYNLGQLVGAGVLSESDVVSHLTAAAAVAGLGEVETRDTIRSGLAAGTREPRTLPDRDASRPDRRMKANVPIADDRALDAELARLPRTDMGNGERLAARAAGRMRYCKPWGRWLVWDGRRYAVDDRNEDQRMAKEAIRKILAEASTIADDDDRKRHVEHARASQARSRLNAMLEMAASEPGVPILPEEMDRDPWLLNCLNGTLDLRTGDLKPHDRADLLTQLCPVEFDPDAKCPLWESTLNLFFAGDQALIAFVQRIFGYALVGVVRDHILPVAYGEGSNGKSTILGAMLEMLGSYAMKAPPDMLMAKAHASHPTDRADLFGKRLVVAIETAEGRRLDEVLVKELTGGDKIRARKLYQDHWEFDPTHTIVMATNHQPVIRGTDNGIWRRLKLVPFTVKVEGSQDDKSMPEKLRAEFPGILAWCVRGCLSWQEIGLQEPETVVAATAEYRTEQDVIGAFLTDRTLVDPSTRARCGDVYGAYKAWAEDAGERALSQVEFGKRMKERGVEKKTSNGQWYIGVGLRDNTDGPAWGVVG